jgi:SAM-dependent methyltransferase
MNPEEPYAYPGNELDLFAQARHWKQYWHSRIQKYLKGAVVEIGAGIGSNTVLLRSTVQTHWLCVEPDAELAARLKDTLQTLESTLPCEIFIGTSNEIGKRESFDTAIYIDVLEHIDSHEEEISNAATLLRPGGHLVVLSPAHDFLFSPFDKQVGHIRRYNRKNLPYSDPGLLRLVHCEYLDSVGMFASLANRFLLRSSLPTPGQIKTWDTWMVPVSRVLDPVFARRVGKSILAVWEKQ